MWPRPRRLATTSKRGWIGSFDSSASGADASSLRGMTLALGPRGSDGKTRGLRRCRLDWLRVVEFDCSLLRGHLAPSTADPPFRFHASTLVKSDGLPHAPQSVTSCAAATQVAPKHRPLFEQYERRQPTVLLVASSGGHLVELLELGKRI